MSGRLPVHIVGGGIGGLAVAVALQKKGYDIHVYEAAPSYAHVGGGHWLYANALHTLQKLDPDIARDMVALGKRFDGFYFTNSAQRRLMFESTAPYTPRPDLAPIVLHRADIIDQLARRIPAERLHFGKRLVRCAPSRLHFEDGTEVSAPLIIGADGIHSRVRQDLLDAPPPRFSGQVGLWGISDHVLPADTGQLFTEMWGNGIRMGFTYVGTGGVYWFMVVREEVPVDPLARKRFILERGAIFPPDLVMAVDKTDALAIHTNPLFDMRPPARWYTQTACCIGDAVHASTPNLGQGGCQAIEDAWCLAEMLEQHEDAGRAFEAFQQQRVRKVTAVVYLSRWLGDVAMARGRLVGALRNTLVWMTPNALVRPLLQWIMSVRLGA